MGMCKQCRHHLREWKKTSHRDQGGQENYCSSGCLEGPTLCFIVSRMLTFHTCARDTVEVVMDKQEVISLGGILCVCWAFVSVETEGWKCNANICIIDNK